MCVTIETASGETWWTVRRGEGPIVAAAIHDGHGLRAEIVAAMALADADRLREEDPFTGQATLDVPTHVIAHRSRFEVDMNRAAENAVYRTPDQSWGLEVWTAPLDDALVARSLDLHARFYAMVEAVLADVVKDHGIVVVLDIHSYNHRRDGPDAPPTPAVDAPEINIGTSSMPRDRWAWLLDPLIEEMRAYDFGGRHLDVRENIAFQGKGELTRFVHERFPETGCAIAIEFKKFFMDEWAGAPDRQALAHMRGFVNHIARAARELTDAR